MRFPLSPDLWQRLPRHPDWRYELIEGEAWLSPRPRPLPLRRETALPVQAMCVDAEVRTLDLPADRTEVAALLLQTWAAEDPYRGLDDSAEVLNREIERDLATAELGAIAVAAGFCGMRGRARARLALRAPDPWLADRRGRRARARLGDRDAGGYHDRVAGRRYRLSC